jgi:chromosome partitioning protein
VAARPADAVRLAAVGLDLLPADPDFRNASPAPRARAFAEALAPLAAAYDVVILDTPPALDLPLVAALAAAHHALTPTQLTPLARDGVKRFAQAFFYASTELNADLASFAVVPVQVDLRTRVQQVALARLIADFGPGRLFPAVRADTALAEAFDHAEPIRVFRPSSRGAEDYARLTERIVADWLGGRREPARDRPAETPAAATA